MITGKAWLWLRAWEIRWGRATVPTDLPRCSHLTSYKRVIYHVVEVVGLNDVPGRQWGDGFYSG